MVLRISGNALKMNAWDQLSSVLVHISNCIESSTTAATGVTQVLTKYHLLLLELSSYFGRQYR